LFASFWSAVIGTFALWILILDVPLVTVFEVG
jgi:hypothetical protein